MNFHSLRKRFHQRICQEIIRIRNAGAKDYPNFADSGNRSSIEITKHIVQQIKCKNNFEDLSGQTCGERFEIIIKDFLQESFNQLSQFRPGNWQYLASRNISEFEQYSHLSTLEKEIASHKILATAIGKDYIVKSDVIIARKPVGFDDLNKRKKIIINKNEIAYLTPFLESNNPEYPILHASISCKWTIRSDRSQNTRTEALNLIRNRKGNLPHIVVVTAEPLPSRLATLAYGTGDLDCVYHFSLYELKNALLQINNEDQKEMLDMMIEGRRLRDISDLPFDLAI